MLAVEIQPNFQLDNARAPDIYAALYDVYDTPNDKPFLLPLNQLLGFIGAHEWHKKGIDIPQLDGKSMFLSAYSLHCVANIWI